MAPFFTSLFRHFENGDMSSSRKITVFVMKWNSGISMHFMMPFFFFKILKLNSFSYSIPVVSACIFFCVLEALRQNLRLPMLKTATG
jgi:hypothetical protein